MRINRYYKAIELALTRRVRIILWHSRHMWLWVPERISLGYRQSVAWGPLEFVWTSKWKQP